MVLGNGDKTMTVHVNDMSHWPEITCQRGHDFHQTGLASVDLSKPHGYHDYPFVSPLLATSFDMYVFDWQLYEEGEGYCPAHDTVSATIASEGIWEPCETSLVLDICQSAPSDSLILDIGAQIGWYSLLAASQGVNAIAFDADDEPLYLLASSAALNDWNGRIARERLRVGPDTEQMKWSGPIRLAKIDVEGAEDQAIRMLWPLITSEAIDYLLIEVSPVFADYYGDLMVDMTLNGYSPFLLPPKRTPPHSFENPLADVHTWRIKERGQDLRDRVATWHQDNVLFMRNDLA